MNERTNAESPKSAARDARTQRLAASLRANLKRRKAQVRNRGQGGPDNSANAPAGGARPPGNES